MLRDLVPADLIKLMGTNDWKKTIMTAHAQDSGKTNSCLFGICLNLHIITPDG
jgi:hypothetical protein